MDANTTHASEVDATFRLTKDELRNGHIRITVKNAYVGEKEVPAEFLLLLMHKDTSEDSWKLYNMLAGLVHEKNKRDHYLELACKDFNKSWNLIKELKENRPRGKPRFYIGVAYDMSVSDRELDLTDGRTSISFQSLFPTDQLELPINAYARPWYTGYELDADRYLKAEGCVEEFFAFARRLKRARKYITRRTADAALDAFFRSKAEGYKTLAEIEKNAGSRRLRDRILCALETKGVLRCGNGFLAYTRCQNYHYVTATGETYKIVYTDNTQLKRIVARAVTKREAPKKLEKTVDYSALEDVARSVGRLAPELFVVMAPQK